MSRPWHTTYQHPYYQDSDLITQSELKGMMNDNSEDGKIQDWYLRSYIPTVSVHGPGHV